MKLPFFSVIIPAHDRPKLLEQAIESILVQSCSEWELIVVDDGSPTPLADELAAGLTDQRIKWLRQENQGPAAARKNGSQEARGDYLCFLDDDDYFLPDHLATLTEQLLLDDGPETVLRTNLEGRYPDGRRVHYPAYRNDRDALKQYWTAPCGLTSLAFPRSVFVRCPIDPSPRIIEDFEWVSRVLVHYELIQISGPATVVYRQHLSNRTQLLDGTKWLSQRLEVIKSAYAEKGVASRVPKSVYAAQLTHQRLHATRQLILGGNEKDAFRLLRQIMLSWPGIRSWKEVAYTLYLLAKERTK